MARQEMLTTTEVRAIFTEEIAARGGTVRDAYQDDSRLFLRSILPETREVRADDRMQNGVALRMDAQHICVHPYVFRLVCKNGAIQAHALQTHQIDCVGILASEQIEAELADAIHACASQQAFNTSIQEARTALDRQADFFLSMLPLLSRLPTEAAHEYLALIFDEYQHAGDHSRFGLMNAVTAVARETADPRMRWRLEEYGGGIPVVVSYTPDLDSPAARSLHELYEALLMEQYGELYHADAVYSHERELASVA